VISGFYTGTIFTQKITGPCIYCEKNNAIQVFVRMEYPDKICEGGMCLICYRELSEFLNWAQGEL